MLAVSLAGIFVCIVFLSYLFFSAVYSFRLLFIVAMKPRMSRPFLMWWRGVSAFSGSEFESRRLSLAGRFSSQDLNCLGTPLAVAYQMLGEAGVDSNSTIVDLGAGKGNFLMAGLLRGVVKVVGLEVQRDLCLMLKRSLAPFKEKVELIHADVCNAVLPDGSHYVLAWTTWSQENRKRLEKRLNCFNTGTKIWVWTHELSEESWEMLQRKKGRFPGYTVEIFLYEKR